VDFIRKEKPTVIHNTGRYSGNNGRTLLPQPCGGMQNFNGHRGLSVRLGGARYVFFRCLLASQQLFSTPLGSSAEHADDACCCQVLLEAGLVIPHLVPSLSLASFFWVFVGEQKSERRAGESKGSSSKQERRQCQRHFCVATTTGRRQRAKGRRIGSFSLSLSNPGPDPTIRLKGPAFGASEPDTWGTHGVNCPFRCCSTFVPRYCANVRYPSHPQASWHSPPPNIPSRPSEKL
jgi:hypothetical protein